MSLRDTIRGAREEAEQANSDAPEPKTAQQKAVEKIMSSDEPKAGFSKRSVSRARPAREAAAGVRVVKSNDVATGKMTSTGKLESEMTKEEKKQAREARRDSEDRRAAASRIILSSKPGYKSGQRMWWILLGVGMACTLLSFALSNIYTADQATGLAGLIMLVLIILAYGCIIVAFVYDWRNVRPLRKAADREVASLSEKRVMQIIEEDYKAAQRKEAARAEAKEARKARRAHRHEQHR